MDNCLDPTDKNVYLEESCRSCIKMDERAKEKEERECLERDAEEEGGGGAGEIGGEGRWTRVKGREVRW